MKLYSPSEPPIPSKRRKIARRTRLIQIVVVGVVLCILTYFIPVFTQPDSIIYIAHAEDVEQIGRAHV